MTKILTQKKEQADWFIPQDERAFVLDYYTEAEKQTSQEFLIELSDRKVGR